MPRGPWWKALLGALLSLLMPGLGQIYARVWRLGIILLATNFAINIVARAATHALPPTLLVLVSTLAVFAASIALNIGAAIDAFRRLRFHPNPQKPRWHHATWFAAVIAYPLSFAIDAILPIGWRSFAVAASSGTPTLLVGDLLMADTNGTNKRPERGDIIVFTLPNQTNSEYVKRVIGLPGDRIRMQDGQLFINNKQVPLELAGEYQFGNHPARRYHETLPNGVTHDVLRFAGNAGPLNNIDETTVPPDAIYVLGDNRDNSMDSRDAAQFGTIPLRNIIGKAATIYWSQDHGRILTEIK